MNLKKILVVIVFVLITSACGPVYSPTLPGPIFIYTQTPITTLTPPAVSIPSTPSPSPAVAELAGSYFTLTIDSNCYDGPGESYNVVVKIPSGIIVEVIGRNRENTWWRVFKEALADCWVANETGTFVGEFVLIPITSSQYATQAWTSLPPTQQNQGNDDVTNSGSSNPPTSSNPPPTDPPTEPPPPTDPPTEPPPPPTDPPTEPPPPTEPLICLPLICP